MVNNLTEERVNSMTEQELDEKRKWLFAENIRIKELTKNLEDERKLIEIQKGILEKKQRKNMLLSKQLENQKNLFDQQWQIMEREIRQLAIDKERFQREKDVFRDNVYREARRGMEYSSNVKIFFKGVDDSTSLKKRYKDIMKIFHPDNTHGDTELIQAINQEYENQNRYYLGT